MADWLSSMEQSFEYYIVDPGTWKNSKRLDGVISCQITRDSEVETLGSVTIDVDGLTSEVYIRAYLVVVQNGVTERFPLATFLVQTPSMSFDGRKQSISLDAYMPLIELKENQPPLGYYVEQDANIMSEAHRIASEHMRAPVVPATDKTTMFRDFVSNSDDTWMTFLTDLVANAKFYFDLDEEGRLFLGSVVICRERAAEQAEEYGHSLRRELYYLAVHGLCHLLGHDHETEEDKRAMRAAEEDVLAEMGIGREKA